MARGAVWSLYCHGEDRCLKQVLGREHWGVSQLSQGVQFGKQSPSRYCTPSHLLCPGVQDPLQAVNLEFPPLQMHLSVFR